MIINYLKIGWRNLIRGRLYSFINVIGLAVGMTVAMLIGLWVHSELSYNTSFENYSRIGMVYHNLDFGGEIITYEGSPYVLGTEFKENVPEFEEVVMVQGPAESSLSVEDNKFAATSIFVDAAFADVFSLSMVEGSRSGLEDKRSIMISRSMAITLFGGSALGKTLLFDKRDLLTVSGVFEDFPTTNHFADADVILPIDYYFSISEETEEQRTSWESLDPACYVLLSNTATWDAVEAKISNTLMDNTTEEVQSLNPRALIHPMTKWNLYAEFKDGKNIGGKVRYVWMMGIVGAFVLILACINFMNLYTARSEKRSKEVGIRKTMGSGRGQLALQFMSETLLIVLMAFCIALVLTIWSLPGFNQLNQTTTRIPWNDFYFISAALIFILVTSFLAGSYPALYLSSFRPVKVLKGSFKAGRLAAIPRKVLVSFQFVISAVLIIITLVVFDQLQFAKERPRGFDLEGIIQVEMKSEALATADYNLIRHDLLETGLVKDVATSDAPITGNMSGDASLTWQGKDPDSQPMVAINRGSHDFPSVNGFQIISGRDFSREFSTDSSAVLINEMAAHLFSPNGDAIGMKLTWGEGEEAVEREIVGIIKDQIRWSPFSKQSPHIYFVDYVEGGYLTIRFREGINVTEALEKTEAILKKYDPESPFEYTFQDDDYARQFAGEERIGKLAGIFSGLAILISCIGIFGLASFAASQRTKEIGIRKVLGATVFSVWKLLSNDFFRIVMIASVIACPVAYYFASQWLQQYEYRIEISWTVFLVTCLALILITLITVSYQSVKAALSNPVESLRSE